MRKSFGPSIKNGIVLRTSPSALQKADPNSPYGCPRKYWYQYVMGISEPYGEPAKLGNKVHAEVEGYLKGGSKAMSAIAMSGLQFYPEPGAPGLELEHAVTPDECFEVASIPVLMYIDCISPNRHYIDPMGTIQEDPMGTVEIVDWKTKGNIKYGLTGTQLLGTIQMVMYGAYGLRRYDTDHVRLSHVYMQTRGARKSSKSTMLATRETIESKWGRIESVGRSIKDYAKEPDVNKIPANLKECGKCFYFSRCPKNITHTAEMAFGKVTTMSLLPTTEPAQDTASHLAALQAEEAAPQVPAGFAAALAFIQVHDYGRPALKGAAYLAACNASGVAPDASGGGAGAGKAGAIVLEDPADVIKVAEEVGAKVGTPFAIPAPVLPADAPESKPELAADPVPGFGAAPATPVVEAIPLPPVVQDVAPGVIAVDVAQIAPIHIETASPQTPNAQLDRCLAAVDSDKWGPIKKPDVIEGFKALLAQKQDARPQGAAIAVSAHDSQEARTVQIYIDCLAPDAKALAPWVSEQIAKLCKEYGCADVRLAPKDGPLGYGAWKAAIGIIVRGNFAALEPGAYYLDTRGSELLEAAAEGLQAHVTARGIR